MTRTCPKCGKEYTNYPAISRIDNVTPICPECGMREAMDTLEILPADQDKIIQMAGDVNHTKTDD